MMRSPHLALALVAAGLLAACGDKPASPPPAAPAPGAAPAAGAPAPAPAAGGGGAFDPSKADATIVVKATLKGTAPVMRPIQITEAKCAAQHAGAVTVEEVVAKDGKLANVIAHVAKGHEGWTFKAPAEPVVIDQKGCMYVPHVFTAMVGQTVAFKNSDPVLHNVHGKPSTGDFNRGQLAGAKDINEKFTKPEVGVEIICDVHGWMKSWAGVFTHPFHGVTAADGTTTIKVPAGDYEIAVWHESKKLGAPAAQKVSVKAGETKEIEFVFEAK
jgi:plastocyanin